MERLGPSGSSGWRRGQGGSPAAGEVEDGEADCRGSLSESPEGFGPVTSVSFPALRLEGQLHGLNSKFYGLVCKEM